MWWIETTGYHLGGLLWLIAIAVIFVIALVALIVAGRAMSRADMSSTTYRERTLSGNTTPAGTRLSRSTVAPMAAPTVAEGDDTLGDSLKILHERYARGEISREEYLRRREDMTGRSAA